VAATQLFAKEKRPNIKHVLLISIAGMQAIDYLNCSTGLASINRGKPYCPNLPALGRPRSIISTARLRARRTRFPA